MTKSSWIKMGKGLAIWIPTVLFSALFIMQGLMKLTSLEGWVQRFREYGYPDDFHIVVGVLELGGAVLLLIPRTARIGAAILGLVMLAAAATHLVQGETPNVFFTLGFAGVFGVIAYVRSDGTRLRQVVTSS